MPEQEAGSQANGRIREARAYEISLLTLFLPHFE